MSEKAPNAIAEALEHYDALLAERDNLKQRVEEWRACAIRYAKGQPTAEDVTIVGLALLNDAIDADKVNKITEAKTI